MQVHKTDLNQPEIVSALRKVGAKVFVASAVGMGFTDLVVGFRGRVFLLEVKQPKKERRLTPSQKEFHAEWGAYISVVTDPIEALVAVGAVRRGQGTV